MSVTVVVKHVNKYVTARPCTQCERPLKGDRLQVRTMTKKRLSFGVGVFCSVKCLLAFAETKRKARQGTIRGWTFGGADHV